MGALQKFLDRIRASLIESQKKVRPAKTLKVKSENHSVAIGGNVTDSSISIVNLMADAEFLRRIYGAAVAPAARKVSLENYLRFLNDRLQYADFKGMGVADRVALKLPLLDLYVPIKARVEMPRGDKWVQELRSAGRMVPLDDQKALGERFSQPIPVDDLLRGHSGLVILGDPGAGKTTFLKQVALLLATGRYPEKRIPFLLPLSAYANAIAEADLPLEAFIPAHLQRESNVHIGEEFQRSLKNGGALVMLDGLDEVRDVHRRQSVVDRVIDFFHLHRRPGNKFLITSRIVGYKEVRRVAEGLEECTLEDFNDEDITAFAGRWTTALERAAQGQNAIAARDAERECAEFVAAVHRNEGVRRLAANPLLLTILALMKRDGITLPDRRVELYDKCISALITSWNRARTLGRPSPDKLERVQTIKILAPLALWMHEVSAGVGLVKEQALLDQLEEQYLKLKIEPRRSSEATALERQTAQAEARTFLDDVRKYTGLLIERGVGQYGFIHLTFEEYLAGVGLADLGQLGIEPTVTEIGKHLHEGHWREVILLSVGYLGLIQGREQPAGAVVDALLGNTTGPLGLHAVLAADAAHDAWPGGITKTCRGKVVTALRDAIHDERITLKVRSELGSALGRLGDPRPGVGTVPSDGEWPERPEWVWCGAGGEGDGTGHDFQRMEFPPQRSFPMGEPMTRSKAERAFNSFDQFACTRITEPFLISKYPVTVAQFQVFVEAGGYGKLGGQKPDWWTDAGWAWRNREKVDRPEDYSLEFQTANHPRVGVSWYEALAYARWLNRSEIRSAMGIPEGWRIALPTEAQWELVARWNSNAGGVDDRLYPWANDEDLAERCNYGATGVGHTSAVGLFPKGRSMSGVMDLSGNVWEWCQTQWVDSPKDYNNPGNGIDSDDGTDSRVVRGGSWNYDDPGSLRSCLRGLNDPGYRYYNLGFRLVLMGKFR